MEWFGTPWGSPVNDPADQAPTPAEEPCQGCRYPIRADESGFLVPSWELGGAKLPFHRECMAGPRRKSRLRSLLSRG